MKIIAIVRAELWQRRWSLLWWSVGVAALVGIDMLLYASVKDQVQQFEELNNRLSPTLRALFSDSGNFLQPAGFLSARVYYLLLPLLLSIFTIGLGANLIGREEQQGTLELLLARPVSRTKLLLSKLLAGGVAAGLLGIVALATAFVCLGPSGLTGISHRALAVATLQAVLLSSLFGMIAFTLTALGRPARAGSVGIAALFAFASYIVTSLESTVHWLRWPATALPYHYYRPSEILAGTTGQKWTVIGFALTMVAMVVISWIGFRRRDIG